MKVAYVVPTRDSVRRLADSILPEIESGIHCGDVKAILLFDQRNPILRKGHCASERLSRVAEAKGISVFACSHCDGDSEMECAGEVCCTSGATDPDHCASAVQCGCWDAFYRRCAAAEVDHIVSL
jgi:hypothetical protein